jgi:hypothetical protein
MNSEEFYSVPRTLSTEFILPYVFFVVTVFLFTWKLRYR